MGEEAFQAEGPQGLQMGHREGGGAWEFRGTLDGAGGWCWAAVRDTQQGGEGKHPRGGLAVIPARGGGHLGEVVGVQQGSQGKAAGMGKGHVLPAIWSLG